MTTDTSPSTQRREAVLARLVAAGAIVIQNADGWQIELHGATLRTSDIACLSESTLERLGA